MISTFIQFTDEDEKDVYLPSRDRIRRMCAEFQLEWTDRERMKRGRVKPQRWTVPEVTSALEPSAILED